MNPPKVIRVTADHIAQGEPGNGEHCPIALAIKEQYPVSPFWGIQVDPDDITVYPGPRDVWLSAKPPLEAGHWIERFDTGSEVAPFEFEVEWIDQDGVAA